MPFVANTPESLLARSDSKDPKSTCRGITSSGRPCRRALGTPAIAAPDTSKLVLPSRGRRAAQQQPDDLADESLYCWQHKEQASHSARSSPGPKGTMHAIREERSSLDTLADRLGLMDLEKKHTKPHDVRYARHRPPQRPPPKTAKAKPASSLQFCCFTVPLEQVDEKPRPRPPRPMEQRPSTASMPVQRPQYAHTPQKRSDLYFPTDSPSKSSYRSGKSTTSLTAQMKHLIPDTVDAATASALMTELARPLADSDEAGYIYMFWLTPESRASAAPVEAARSLLSAPTPSQSSRRASDAVSRFAGQGKSSSKKTMLLKIGRAANVQRRMNQWQRQCGYDVEVLRYYPYTGDGASPAQVNGSSAMTPHSKRVERLVHIELSGMGLRATMQKCSACGRDHREWFEIGAARDDVRRVDAVIRRWVDWDLQGQRVA